LSDRSPADAEPSDGQAVAPPARPTLTDVARLARVSRQTASRVARGGDQVNARTAARVRRAIKTLGYRPDPIARALSTGRGRVLGLLTHQLTNRPTSIGAMSIISGVEQAATDLGYSVSIASFATFDPAAVQEGIDRLAMARCDGVIFMAPWVSGAETIMAIDRTMPMVTTSTVPGYDGPAVHADMARSSEEVVEYLLGLGHATVHHVAGPAEWSASHLRALGWEQALRRAGAEVVQPLRGDWTARSGYVAGLELAEDPSVTAIFASNDETALGLMYALTERGLRIPEDISVVGYDDAPGSDYFRPALTTVRVDGYEHGRTAVAHLIAQLDGQPTEPTVIVPHELVIRRSTGKAPRRRRAVSTGSRQRN
jgi:DNA-binding LacI/PurR family transcriptional regulator